MIAGSGARTLYLLFLVWLDLESNANYFEDVARPSGSRCFHVKSLMHGPIPNYDSGACWDGFSVDRRAMFQPSDFEHGTQDALIFTIQTT